MGTHHDYVSGMQRQFRQWDAQVDAIAADAKKAEGEARTEYARRLKELRLARKAGQKSFEELRVATESAGASVQAAMQASWESMQALLKKVSADLRPAGGEKPGE